MVMNVTFVDKGTYSCMCEYETSQWSAPVKLNVYHATPGKVATLSSTLCTECKWYRCWAINLA